ncbi:MAG: hypothetical protein H6658_11070 [Ardenticatenaceae bacterium]|nr:hypothetical protein [Ardenticatenaceae bacterium]
MTQVSILPIQTQEGRTTYHAIAGNKQSFGQTAGQALDAITAQLEDEETGTLVIVQNQRPDRFFTAAQIKRLTELMQHWRDALNQGQELSLAEQSELEALIDAELQASAQRAAAILNDLTP